MSRRNRDFVIDAIASATRQELEDGLALRTDLHSGLVKKSLAGRVWKLTIKLRDGVAPRAYGASTAGARRRAAGDGAVPDYIGERIDR
ncbi:hypothetical protein JYT11_00395 [Planctomycetaceae bacterium AH-315-I19]|nr:hypothetical protein [Planctomycetaceae bacterium AH-315-I19]